VALAGYGFQAGRAAAARASVRSIPNAYSPEAFAEDAVTMGAKFAGPAAASVYKARLLMEACNQAEQPQHAIGIIRSRSGASAEEALGQLVRVSQSMDEIPGLSSVAMMTPRYCNTGAKQFGLAGVSTGIEGYPVFQT